jgi:hypothetical protein
VPTAPGGAEARGANNVDTEVALRIHSWFARVQTHADANILSAGPFVSSMRALCRDGRRDSLSGTSECKEERVPLSVDLDAPVLAERGSDNAAVVRNQLCIALAEALEKARRPLNVAEEESDGSSGQICQSL